MKIEKSKFVAINYRLSLDNGEEVEKSDPADPLGFIHGFGMLIPGLERQIEGMKAGDNKEVVVEAEEGYGKALPELIRPVPRDQFQGEMDIQAGQSYASQTSQGVVRFTVKSVEEDTVTIDLNHPLADQRLHFDVTVVEVRDATEEELQALNSNCSDADCAGCGGHCG